MPRKVPRRDRARDRTWSFNIFLAFVGAFGVLLVALALTAITEVFLKSSPVDEAMAPGQGGPKVYRAWPQPSVFGPIADRAKDSRPLTAEEVFGKKTLSHPRVAAKEGEKAEPLTLRLEDRRVDADCRAAARGEAMAETLAEADCSQVARARYVSEDGVYVAQYSLFNLRDAASAERLVTTLKTRYVSAWVAPLESTFASGGYSEGDGHVMGHYAGLVWIGRADGAKPGRGDDLTALSLAVRGAEKAVFARIVAASS
ncbi:hypothetical protein [Bailinhaonella thermotolerans]|uniref:Uncharacterized protein n=1 Tax=Bailinhaonella thermotolerans TaxID=1070861 RepID=A0A3A4A7W2_9ACTN|nr:hypothetical protein [Bailinhaonella thermotolerans]RJL24695.1 hypothetical protein D5H75_28255 [Bailinhaonella thermotolerans]